MCAHYIRVLRSSTLIIYWGPYPQTPAASNGYSCVTSRRLASYTASSPQILGPEGPYLGGVTWIQGVGVFIPGGGNTPLAPGRAPGGYYFFRKEVARKQVGGATSPYDPLLSVYWGGLHPPDPPAL